MRNNPLPSYYTVPSLICPLLRRLKFIVREEQLSNILFVHPNDVKSISELLCFLVRVLIFIETEQTHKTSHWVYA